MGLHPQLEGVENIFNFNHTTLLYKVRVDWAAHDLICLTGPKLCTVLVNTEFDE